MAPVDDLPTYKDVADAAAVLDGVARRTPIETSQSLDDQLGGVRCFIKCENMQRMGAFKFRGAYQLKPHLLQHLLRCLLTQMYVISHGWEFN